MSRSLLGEAIFIVFKLFNHHFSFFRPENPSPIVLYGSSQPECVKHTEWLAKKLEDLQQDRKAVAIMQPAADTPQTTSEDPFEQFCNTIADRVKEIWILKGGYEVFCSEYQFLCGDISFESMFPLPHQISSSLFLGSRVVSLTQDILSKLLITHLIVASSQKIEWSELRGVSVLQCNVEDRNDQDMFPCWRACTSFIDEALDNQATAQKAEVKVLVLLHGRSRSTSVILAYLIKHLQIGFEEAWSMVRSKCWHLIDRSLVYEKQLKEWEQFENNALKIK